MKRRFMKWLSVAMALCMVAGTLSACSGGGAKETKAPEATATKDTSAETQAPTVATDESKEETTARSADTLVVGYDYFSSKFSPFFAKTAYDQDLAEMTSIYLLVNDREGNILLNAKDGETVAYNGTDYTYYSLANCTITENADGTVTYDMDLRDDVTFSDGTPLTADDVIFSLYVYCDPTYDGSSVIYGLPIVGMNEYRSGMDTLSTLILNAGRDNTDFTNFSEEDATKFWNAVDEAGAKFAQDIVDFVVGEYGDSLADYGNSEVALGMAMWGYGAWNDDKTKFVGASTAREWTLEGDDVPTAADYWTELFTAYAGDLTAISDTETANNDFFSFFDEILGDDAAKYNKGVATGDSVPNITGIEKTGDYSVRLTLSELDATAIYQMNFLVAPLHYYGSTDKYDYENNKFGFDKGDLSTVKEKTTKPLGAGAYVFQDYKNGIVSLTANESYFKGAPKIKNLLLKETLEADKLSGIVSGTFDITNPSMSVDVLNYIKEYNGNDDVDGDVITTSLIDNLGYGYMGINANNVKVGDDPASEESKDLRKAWATMFAVYRDSVINSYYGEMASIIQYPISNTSWAAPKPADEGYEAAYSKDVEGNALYTADMSDEQKYEAALQAAIDYLKAAGYTWDEASGKFTAAPAGAEMSYEVIIPGGGSGDHPAYGILTNVKEAMASIGITLEINDPADSNVLWNATESGTNEMWVAAWQATADPDMYQVYHSSNIVGKGGTDSNSYGIADDELDTLIMDARKSTDQAVRKPLYKQALERILDWGVEIPIYQRQNAVIFSTERVNMDTMTKDITPFYKWFYGIENVELN